MVNMLTGIIFNIFVLIILVRGETDVRKLKILAHKKIKIRLTWQETDLFTVHGCINEHKVIYCKKTQSNSVFFKGKFYSIFQIL